MQEEVSIREVLKTLWDGKILIVVITAICTAFMFIISSFFINPTYESIAMVRLEISEDNEYISRLNSLVETTKGDASLNRILNKLSLNPEQFSISKLRNMISISVVKDSKVVSIKVKGSNADIITKISNLLAFELGARTEITDRSDLIIKKQTQLQTIEEDLPVLSAQLAEVNEQLIETPGILTTKKTVSEDPLLHSLLQESDRNAIQAGSVGLIEEEINPLHTSLKSKQSEFVVELRRLEETKATLTRTIEENQTIISNLEQQIQSEKLKATNSERLLNGFNAVFISPAIEPTTPIGPNVVVNTLMGMAVGFVFSSLIVYLRFYLKYSGPANKTFQQSV